MKHSLSLLLILLILLPLSGADAQDSNTVTAATGIVNIRSGPSTATTIIGSMYPSEVLPVTGRSGNGWWRVESRSGTGWVSSRVVAFRGDHSTVPIVTEPAGTMPQTTVVAVRGPVTIYSTPNESAFVVGVMPSGSSASVIGQTADGSWYQINTGVVSGFVYYGSVARRGNFDGIVIVGDPGPSFRGPTVRVESAQAVVNDLGEVFAELPAGSTLPVIGRNADNTRWRVSPDGIGGGWIMVSNVSLAGSASSIPLRSAETVAGPPADGAIRGTATVIVDRKLFYASPSYSVVMLDGGRGTEVGLIGRSDDGLWLNIMIRGNSLWMAFGGVTFNGNMADLPVIDTTPPNRNHVVINAYQLHVRSGPGAEYTALAVVDGGDTLRTTGVHPNRVWWRVEGDFGAGWVRTRHILFRGDISRVPLVTEPVGELAPATGVTKIGVVAYRDAALTIEAGVLATGAEFIITGRTADWSAYQLETPLGLVWIPSGGVYFRGYYEHVPVIQ